MLPSQLNVDVLHAYVHWLKTKSGLSYTGAAGVYRRNTMIFKIMNNHPDITQNFSPPKNVFPKSELMKQSSTGYSKEELKQILQCVVSDLRELSQTLEREYKLDG